MDSRERDERMYDGFGERGDFLYEAGADDERNNYREEKKRKRSEKDRSKYNPGDEDSTKAEPDKVNDQIEKNAMANEYGLDDEEAEDLEDLPDADEEADDDEDE